MNSKLMIAAAVVGSSAAVFALGRYTAPEKVRVETKTVTVEVEKKTETKAVAKDLGRKTHTVSTTRPDGTQTVETTTETEVVSRTAIASQSEASKVSQASTSKTVESSKSHVTIQVLAGLQNLKLDTPVFGLSVFGLSVSRPLLGPVVIGVWAFSNKTYGVSAGLQF